jgi:AcrR family transcriptional regulator
MTANNQDAKLTRREREKLRHRREILEAAERVFVDKGFERATVEDIAREAEFSVGAIYTFFDNKEGLCSEVMAKIAEDFLDDFRQEVEGSGGPLEAIAKVIEVRLRHVQDHGGFLRLFMESKPGSRVTPDSAVPQNCRGLYDTYVTEVAALFKAAMAKGLVRKTDPLYAALSLEGAINAFSAYWGRKEMSLSLAEQVETVRRNCLEMLETRDG